MLSKRILTVGIYRQLNPKKYASFYLTTISWVEIILFKLMARSSVYFSDGPLWMHDVGPSQHNRATKHTASIDFDEIAASF